MNVLELENRADAEAPANAFGFGSGEVEFKLQEDKKSAPLRMLARTGDALSHWYWGRIVHDFAGMQHRPNIPVDYEHFTSDPIGVIDTFKVENGDLYLEGSLVSIAEGDEAHKLMLKKEGGIPFQASIFFDPENLTLEYVGEGMSVEVNNRTMQGPLVVARQWQLRGVAITPHGYDVNTESMFSAPSGAFSLSWKGEPMTKPEAKPEAQKTADDSGELNANDKQQVDAKPEAKAELSKPAEKDYREVAKDYAAKFGKEDGFGYFSEGLSLEAAALKHCETLQTKLSAETERANAAEQKLAAAELSLGEKDAVETGAKESSQKNAGDFAGLFRKQGAA